MLRDPDDTAVLVFLFSAIVFVLLIIPALIAPWVAVGGAVAWIVIVALALWHIRRST